MLFDRWMILIIILLLAFHILLMMVSFLTPLWYGYEAAETGRTVGLYQVCVRRDNVYTCSYTVDNAFTPAIGVECFQTEEEVTAMVWRVRALSLITGLCSLFGIVYAAALILYFWWRMSPLLRIVPLVVLVIGSFLFHLISIPVAIKTLADDLSCGLGFCAFYNEKNCENEWFYSAYIYFAIIVFPFLACLILLLLLLRRCGICLCGFPIDEEEEFEDSIVHDVGSRPRSMSSRHRSHRDDESYFSAQHDYEPEEDEARRAERRGVKYADEVYGTNDNEMGEDGMSPYAPRGAAARDGQTELEIDHADEEHNTAPTAFRDDTFLSKSPNARDPSARPRKSVRMADTVDFKDGKQQSGCKPCRKRESDDVAVDPSAAEVSTQEETGSHAVGRSAPPQSREPKARTRCCGAAHPTDQEENPLDETREPFAERPRPPNAVYASHPPEEYPLPDGDWEWDPATGMYWSEEQYLFLSTETGHFYDPNSHHWYNPETEAWYPAD